LGWSSNGQEHTAQARQGSRRQRRRASPEAGAKRRITLPQPRRQPSEDVIGCGAARPSTTCANPRPQTFPSNTACVVFQHGVQWQKWQEALWPSTNDPSLKASVVKTVESSGPPMPPPVPWPGRPAGRGCPNWGGASPTGDLDLTSKFDQPHPPLHRRHGHRDSGYPAAPLWAVAGDAPLPPDLRALDPAGERTKIDEDGRTESWPPARRQPAYSSCWLRWCRGKKGTHAKLISGLVPKGFAHRGWPDQWQVR